MRKLAKETALENALSLYTYLFFLKEPEPKTLQKAESASLW